MLIGTSLRRLNDGVDYATFRRAWLPDEAIPGDPRRVLSALSLDDPQEILTCALIDAEPADIPVWMERIAAGEQRRMERLAGLVGPSLGGGVFRVVGDDDLSRLIRA
ncbi:hypothetical protein N4G70_14620 [Streptomyces sp. ASQP_92]|uniref:hypothetical protein n=1 Tax=unclassified Streptomyces TaxID=2593676 RepID=UPI0021C1E07D|nr:hypothetical protein [Streptomyces sp. ASQP_92]MCT9090094.1 hypothetical protein [Streptomyces sp. ASQP_92]